MNIEIIQDRAFDAECAKRAGMIDLHDKIISKLIATYPNMVGYIQQVSHIYSGVGDFLTTPRGEWLKEKGENVRLKYR